MFRSFLREAEIDDFDFAVRLSRRKQKILDERRRSLARSVGERTILPLVSGPDGKCRYCA